MKRRGKMLCSIYKWKISKAMDSGKPTSGKVQKHMSKCPSCREYAELCTALKPRFTQDKQAILEEFDESLNKKIMAAIPEKPELGPVSERKAVATKRPFRKPVLVPSLAAAITVLAISISLFFFVLPRSKQSPSVGQISTLVSAASPENILLKVESPLEKEFSELKRTFESTSKYLISSFEFRLGQQAK
jgi:hypothetical protein